MFFWLSACGGSDKKGPEGPEPLLGDDDEIPSDHHSRAPDIDDEPDDENLEIEGLKGVLDQHDIRRGVEPKQGKFGQCFQSRTGKIRYVGGKVVLAYTVARDGSVKVVRVIESSLGSWSVEKCLLDVARSMSFAKPKGGEADFTLPLDFPARGAAIWWSEDQADQEVGERIAELAQCAETSGARDPANVWVTAYVGTRGQVGSVGFASPSKEPIDEAWADCAADAVGAWALTDPRGKVAKLSFRYNPE